MNQRGFISPTLLVNPWVMAGLAAAFAVYSFVLYNKGYNSGYLKYVEYKAQVDAAQERIAAENAAKLRDAESATKDVSLAWDRAVNDLRADYASRLRGIERGCAAVSANAATARLVNEATSQPTTGAGAFEATCFEIERNAAVDAAQVLYLQDYLKRVCK